MSVNSEEQEYLRSIGGILVHERIERIFNVEKSNGNGCDEDKLLSLCREDGIDFKSIMEFIRFNEVARPY